MLRAERLFADRQRALVERPCPRKVALVLKQAAEVVEALCRMGCSGPSTFSPIVSASRKSVRSLGIGCAPEEIAACPTQKLGPVQTRSVFGMRLAQREQMRM